MRVSEVMTRGVQKIRLAASAADAQELMQIKQIHHLVVMEGSALVGVVSARDVVGRRGAGGDRSIADVMTRRVVTIDAHAQLQRAANVMRGRSIGCLVVTEDDRVTGIVTVSDLLDLVGRRGTRPATPAARASTHYRVPHRKQHRAGGAW